MEMRTSLGRALGRGSARNGLRHWRLQRLSAVALVPLMLWWVGAMVYLAGGGYGRAHAWLHTPVNAVLMLAALGALFVHAFLGIQVVIEDYIASERAKFAWLWLLKFALTLLALYGALAVLRVATGG